MEHHSIHDILLWNIENTSKLCYKSLQKARALLHFDPSVPFLLVLPVHLLFVFCIITLFIPVCLLLFLCFSSLLCVCFWISESTLLAKFVYKYKEFVSGFILLCVLKQGRHTAKNGTTETEWNTVCTEVT